MTRVSIVVPFLNAAPFLAEAIASVQAQTWADWELLLVDDGSTDGSDAIAARAAGADERVHLITRAPGSPRGAAAARNVGIIEARGELVAFLDADDVYEPHQLSSLVGAFEQHPEVAMVYGPTCWWYPGAEQQDWTETTGRLAGRVHPPPKLLNRVLLQQRGHVPCTCGVMIQRAALQHVGGFEETFELYEDQTLWAKLLLRFPVYVTDVAGARYRQHDESVTARSERSGVYDRMRPHAARVAFLTWTRDHARTSAPADASVERALRLALAPYDAETKAALTWRDRATLVAFATNQRAAAITRRFLRVLRGHAVRLLDRVTSPHGQ